MLFLGIQITKYLLIFFNLKTLCLFVFAYNALNKFLLHFIYENELVLPFGQELIG